MERQLYQKVLWWSSSSSSTLSFWAVDSTLHLTPGFSETQNYLRQRHRRLREEQKNGLALLDLILKNSSFNLQQKQVVHSFLQGSLTVAAAAARAAHAIPVTTPFPLAAGLAAWVGRAFGWRVAVAPLAALQVAHALVELQRDRRQRLNSWWMKCQQEVGKLTVRSRLGSHRLRFTGSMCPSLRITVRMAFSLTRASPLWEHAISTRARNTTTAGWRLIPGAGTKHNQLMNNLFYFEYSLLIYIYKKKYPVYKNRDAFCVVIAAGFSITWLNVQTALAFWLTVASQLLHSCLFKSRFSVRL